MRAKDGWTQFSAAGLATPLIGKTRIDQRARLVAFPTYTGGVRAAFETIVLDVNGGRARAYRSFVDARTGEVLFRSNEVKQAADNEPGTFSGNTGDGCGDPHPVSVSGAYGISAVATANLPSDDIVLKLIGPAGSAVASSDTGTSPEAVNYTTTARRSPTAPTSSSSARSTTRRSRPAPTASTTPAATLINTAAGAPSHGREPVVVVLPQRPRPATTASSAASCSPPAATSASTAPASRGPWDALAATGTPTFTTQGNAARTAEARLTPLTPGPYGFMPTSLTREYKFPLGGRVGGRPSATRRRSLVPGSGADVSAAVANLFAGHNRFHDYAYHLGFTELNYNMQQSNFGQGKDGDPEIGNVQAGAVTGGAPSYLGRDNANQITLNDGIPGITNQYLFQPIAGAFYGPCVDGDFDTSVFGHEYTHAISNRMVGGPDDGLTGFQGGSMGESLVRPRRARVPALARPAEQRGSRAST